MIRIQHSASACASCNWRNHSRDVLGCRPAQDVERQAGLRSVQHVRQFRSQEKLDPRRQALALPTSVGAAGRRQPLGVGAAVARHAIFAVGIPARETAAARHPGCPPHSRASNRRVRRARPNRVNIDRPADDSGAPCNRRAAPGPRRDRVPHRRVPPLAYNTGTPALAKVKLSERRYKSLSGLGSGPNSPALQQRRCAGIVFKVGISKPEHADIARRTAAVQSVQIEHCRGFPQGDYGIVDVIRRAELPGFPAVRARNRIERSGTG